MSITWVGTILIVQYYLNELELISPYFRDQGYNIIKAINAQAALEIVLEEKPNAIVTDVVMPGMSGFELCRFLKSHPIHYKVLIVICSHKNQAMHEFWAIKQGADAYITKPYTAEQLLSVIQSIPDNNL